MWAEFCDIYSPNVEKEEEEIMEEKLKQILNHYGEEAQANQYRQELSELTVGLTKKDDENIKEEIADVKVMTKQCLMFENVDTEKYKEWKNSLEKNRIKDKIEHTLSLAIVVIQERILINDMKTIGYDIAVLEHCIDRYMEINNISKEEIEKEMERKINRQLKRIEREKVNK